MSLTDPLRACFLSDRCPFALSSRNFKFDDVHNLGARRIAKIAKENDVARFIHVSHINADVNSTSTFYQVRGWSSMMET